MKQAISAGHEETLAAAKTILENGGNAFDAGIAAAIAMFITETCMSSAGAGGFAMCYTPREGVQMLDFFTQTPSEKKEIENRDFYPIEVNFGIETEIFHVGLASSAVPGIIKGLFQLHTRYGTMPFKDLLEPARKLAKNGCVVNEFQHIDISLLEAILSVDESVKDIFFKDGRKLAVGETMYMPHLNSFLDMLEHEGERGFYQGEISRIVSEDSKERGGYLQRCDFEKYEAFWRKPLKYSLYGNQIYLPNTPSLGGALMSLAFDRFSKNNNWVSTIEEVQKEYRSLSEIQGGMDEYLPELDYQLSFGPISRKGTSHFNILDKHGNAISFTVSIGEGCGYFIPGTDIQMNNMLGESFLLPDGFHSWAPNTRLHSMMTPTMMTDDQGAFIYSGGSGGAGRIPYMIAQVIDQLYRKNLDLKTATEAARVFVGNQVLHAEVGAGIFGDVSHLDLKNWEYKSLFFGGVHSITKDKKGLIEAVGDSRRYGVGEVF